ncbi:hypothetical protein WG8_5259 [Paenibacillus sp. Aloe-11]|nr:hypothetical protein WG8_5259 [Paenibacillus sp. Aloe-11]
MDKRTGRKTIGARKPVVMTLILDR